MRLCFVRIENMGDFHAAGFQVIGNESTVTTPPHRFRAHDRSRPGFASESEKVLDAILELLCLHVIGIPAK